MRYSQAPDITFVDHDGRAYPLKDKLPVKTYQTGDRARVGADTDIDEIISRRDYYGDDAEDLSYAVVDQNIVKLVEADFDLTRIKEIAIPVITEI